MDAITAFLISLLAIPTIYALNRWPLMESGMALFLVACVVLVVIILLSIIVVRLRRTAGGTAVRDPFVYVFSLFSFTAVVDLYIGFELTGIVNEYIVFYLKEGEPYLVTAHGAIINYWDGIGHNAMYLLLIHFITSNYPKESFRSLGFYWVGSIFNSMPVLLGGAVTGKFSPMVKPSFFLNTPYVLCPLLYGFRLSKEHRELRPVKSGKHQRSLTLHALDIILSVGFVLSIAIHIFRGIAALGSKSHYFHSYAADVEPYLLSPTKFSTIQVLLYLFYQVPACVGIIYALNVPGCRWLIDLACLVAGATFQGQLSYIFSSLHLLTPEEFRVPSPLLPVFWCVNLLVVIVPHLLLARCHLAPNFFFNSGGRHQD